LGFTLGVREGVASLCYSTISLWNSIETKLAVFVRLSETTHVVASKRLQEATGETVGATGPSWLSRDEVGHL